MVPPHPVEGDAVTLRLDGQPINFTNKQTLQEAYKSPGNSSSTMSQFLSAKPVMCLKVTKADFQTMLERKIYC